MGIRQTAGIVPAIGGGHEVTVVEAVGDTTDKSDVAVHVEIVAVDILRGSELHELHLRGFVRQADAVAAEALLLLVVDRESAERAHRMLAESTVIGDGVLASPLEITGSINTQPVTGLTLTNLRTAGAEGLGVAVVHVDGEQGGQFETTDRSDMDTARAPEIHAVAPFVTGQQQTQRVHGITVDIGEVAAVLGNVLRILGGGTAKDSGVRTRRGIGLGGRRHPEGGEDDTRMRGVVVDTAAEAVVIGHGLGELEPLVHLVFTLETDAQILLVGTHHDTLVVLIVEGETALEHVGTVVERHGVALVGSDAEALVHEVGALHAHPRVDGRIPTGRQADAGVLVGDGLHPDFFLRREGLGKVVGAADPGDRVILHMDTLVGLLGGDEDNTAGTGSGTVDSGGGRVLQDDDALDVVHGNDGGARDAVHDPQHGVTVAGALATDDHALSAGRLTAIVGDDHARDLALQHEGRGRHRPLDDLVSVVHDTHGSGQVLLLGLGAVTEGDGLLQDFDILFQDHINGCASIHGDLLGHITQAGHLEDCVGRDSDGVSTIHVRNGVGSAAEHDRAHDGAGGVRDGSTHCQVLRRRAERCRKAQQPCEQSEQFFGKHNGWLMISVYVGLVQLFKFRSAGNFQKTFNYMNQK